MIRRMLRFARPAVNNTALAAATIDATSIIADDTAAAAATNKLVKDATTIKSVTVFIVNCENYRPFDSIVAQRGTRAQVLCNTDFKHAMLYPYYPGRSRWRNVLCYKFFPPARIEAEVIAITQDTVVARGPLPRHQLWLLVGCVCASVWTIFWWSFETSIVGWKLTVPPPKGFRPEWSPLGPADEALLRDADEPQLFFLIGPKVVGKTWALQGLPSRLQRRALFVDFEPSSKGDILDAVYNKLRSKASLCATPRPPMEQKGDYIRAACQGAMILIDVKGGKEEEWARAFSKQVRTLWEEAGVTIVVTTSDGWDIVDTNSEPRRHVRIVPELSWAVTEEVLQEAWRFQHPEWKDTNPLPEHLMEAGKYIPRHFIDVKELVTTYPTEKAFLATHRRVMEQHMRDLRITLQAAKCPRFRPPFADALSGDAVSGDSIVDWCSGNEAAPKKLMRSNVLRPLQSANGKAVDRNYFKWQFDYWALVADQLPKLPSSC